ncbi:response regulator [Labilibacter sediminis]|nr:response regulator [Labilibacter sediminis]
MKKIKVLIADDDFRMNRAVERILNQNFISIEVVAQTSTVENTIETLYQQKPHVAILDLHLIGGTAVEVVRRTRDLDFKVIFMSAYQEFALDDIRFASIDFVYKPLDISELLVVVDQVISGLVEEGYRKKMNTFFKNTSQESIGKDIVFKTRSGIVSVPIGNIVCGHSDYGLSRFYFLKRPAIAVNQPLRRYESMLQSYNFYRCESHYIINLNQIDRLEMETGSVLMNNGQLVPVDYKRMGVIKDYLRAHARMRHVSVGVLHN